MKTLFIHTKLILILFMVIGLFSCLTLTACSSKSKERNVILFDHLSKESEKGFIDVYCTRCVTGWAIYRSEKGQEMLLGQRQLGKKLSETLRAPTRMRRIRIALPPGSHETTIKLLPQSLVNTIGDVGGHISEKVTVRVTKGQLTPLRIDFKRKTERQFSWEVNEGPVLPFKINSDSLKTLEENLNDQNWEKRWFAAQILGHYAGALPNPILTRLTELSGRNEYRRCIKLAKVEECSLIRESALQTLEKFLD
ncbi:MAG TPA: hypothetical protein VGB26_05250 [Nitrospiria bacterium]